MGSVWFQVVWRLYVLQVDCRAMMGICWELDKLLILVVVVVSEIPYRLDMP